MEGRASAEVLEVKSYQEAGVQMRCKVMGPAGLCLLLGLAGCAAAPSRRSFDASPERLLEAVRAVLSHCPGVREEGDVIRTGFCTEPVTPELRRSRGNWREWHEVRIEGSTVEVRSSAEESGLYQHGAHRWERRNSRDVEEAILEAIGRRLKEGT